MGLFSSNSENNPAVQVEKINVAKTMKLIRIIDWELEVVLYTDTTREGYTSVPFNETRVDPEDAPRNIKEYLESE
ncbi:hypothetical protein [Haloquadratum walsbyi]|jgi:hypothetical protein|uniref:hypothetical protein n=1 Tax=Haloquadratum walsbyi TaxID=293091 RepID=UPI0023F2817D|nr:hypothetical protein [Haloquadratum walsbyi]